MAAYSKVKISEAIDNAVATVGLEGLKKEQREAIESFVEGQDVFVTLPTGTQKTVGRSETLRTCFAGKGI